MKIKVENQVKIGKFIYGYCICGRELRKDKDSVCPLCNAKVEWESTKSEI